MGLALQNHCYLHVQGARHLASLFAYSNAVKGMRKLLRDTTVIGASITAQAAK